MRIDNRCLIIFVYQLKFMAGIIQAVTFRCLGFLYIVFAQVQFAGFPDAILANGKAFDPLTLCVMDRAVRRYDIRIGEHVKDRSCQGLVCLLIVFVYDNFPLRRHIGKRDFHHFRPRAILGDGELHIIRKHISVRCGYLMDVISAIGQLLRKRYGSGFIRYEIRHLFRMRIIYVKGYNFLVLVKDLELKAFFRNDLCRLRIHLQNCDRGLDGLIVFIDAAVGFSVNRTIYREVFHRAYIRRMLHFPDQVFSIRQSAIRVVFRVFRGSDTLFIRCNRHHIFHGGFQINVEYNTLDGFHIVRSVLRRERIPELDDLNVKPDYTVLRRGFLIIPAIILTVCTDCKMPGQVFTIGGISGRRLCFSQDVRAIRQVVRCCRDMPFLIGRECRDHGIRLIPFQCAVPIRVNHHVMSGFIGQGKLRPREGRVSLGNARFIFFLVPFIKLKSSPDYFILRLRLCVFRSENLAVCANLERNVQVCAVAGIAGRGLGLHKPVCAVRQVIGRCLDFAVFVRCKGIDCGFRRIAVAIYDYGSIRHVVQGKLCSLKGRVSLGRSACGIVIFLCDRETAADYFVLRLCRIITRRIHLAVCADLECNVQVCAVAGIAGRGLGLHKPVCAVRQVIGRCLDFAVRSCRKCTDYGFVFIPGSIHVNGICGHVVQGKLRSLQGSVTLGRRALGIVILFRDGESAMDYIILGLSVIVRRIDLTVCTYRECKIKV